MWNSAKRFLQVRFINLLDKHLFHFPDENEIVVLKDGRPHYQGNPLNKEGIQRVSADAKAIRDTFGWKLIIGNVRYVVSKEMYDKGKSESDILAGKMALYVVKLMERIAQDLEKLK